MQEAVNHLQHLRKIRRETEDPKLANAYDLLIKDMEKFTGVKVHVSEETCLACQG